MNQTYRLHVLPVLIAATALAACNRVPPNAAAPTIEPWPFTVDDVVLSCHPAAVPAGASDAARRTLREHGSQVFVTTTEGTRYAVNGTARSEAPLMRDIQATVDTRPLIQRGLSLCHGDRGGSERLVRRAPQVTANEAAQAPPTYTLTPKGYRDGYFATAQADQVINGKRPELTLACERGHAPMVMLDLVEPPRTPPPLRGVYATFAVGDAAPQRVEMSWGAEEDWTLRSGDDRALDTQLARAFLAGGQVTFTGASRYMPNAAITWDFSGFGEDLARIRRECLAEG